MSSFVVSVIVFNTLKGLSGEFRTQCNECGSRSRESHRHTFGNLLRNSGFATIKGTTTLFSFRVPFTPFRLRVSLRTHY